MSRWLRTSHGRISRPSLSKPMRRTIARRVVARRPRSGRRACPCAMSCRSAPSSSSSGRRHARATTRVDVDLAAGVGARRRRRAARAHCATASSRCRSTVKRWYALRCGRDRTCSHSGSSRTSTPSWSSASNTGTAPAPARRSRTKRGALPHVPGRLGQSPAAGPATPGRTAASSSAAAARRLERAQRRDRAVGVGVDVHTAVAQPRHLRRATSVGGAARPPGPVERGRGPATTRRPRSTRSRAPRARSCTSASASRTRAASATASCSCSARRSERPPVDALQRDADVEQQLRPRRDAREVVGRRGSRASIERRGAARRAERPAGPLERLQVAQSAGAFLEVGFEHLGDRGPGRSRRSSAASASAGSTRALPARRELARLAFELVGERRVARRRCRTSRNAVQRVEVVVGERDRLLDRARAVTGDEPGVPQRVPAAVRSMILDRVALLAAAQVVHEQHVDVGARAQLPARVRTERDERDPSSGPSSVGEHLDERRVDRVGQRGAERAPAQRRCRRRSAAPRDRATPPQMSRRAGYSASEPASPGPDAEHALDRQRSTPCRRRSCRYAPLP